MTQLLENGKIARTYCACVFVIVTKLEQIGAGEKEASF